ncbi:MAG TPA: GrpB family protein [Solirubrobacteraceae bacterium]|jgi:GrpB-like predicted nucleotidyltransferase (UPF0157 family)|nr:GrpB family protein [Solirubrobacteraceae bacterium]
MDREAESVRGAESVGPAELIGGRERRRIEVVPYDPSWPERFAGERARIAGALGPLARRIVHIGPTAVDGLPAKPIVDIDVSVDDPDDEASYVPPLEAAGYLLRVREPGHRMLRTPALDVHVRVNRVGGDWERRHLLFRDWLRTDAADRARYAAAKHELGRREWVDMNAYADAKTSVIEQIMEHAERWAHATSWTPR